MAAAQIKAPAVHELRRFVAEEANQGVASGAGFIYAISNSSIGKYSKATGKRVLVWHGDPSVYIHINSCVVAKSELACAMSNYPNTPMASSVEFFSTATLKHLRSHSFGPGRGSLTWIDWHAGSWWACFANYSKKGGETPRDHRSTVLVKFGPDFAEHEAWLFPEDLLERFAPYSASGGRWGAGGRLYVTGHTLPEMYVLQLPEAGARLVHLNTIQLVTPGQAFDWDFGNPDRLWTIDRSSRSVVESQLPHLP